MIAAHDGTAHRPHARAHLIRRSVIADHVAQIDDLIVRGRSVHAGVERLQVGMNVAEQEQAQRSAYLLRSDWTARQVSGKNLNQRGQGIAATGDAPGAARLESAARRRGSDRRNGALDDLERFGAIGAQGWH